MKYDYTVPQFERERMQVEIDRYYRVQEKREAFIKCFPIKEIMDLSLDDYAFVNAKDGDSNSFCTTLYSKMEEVAHTGNQYTHIYGIYYKKGKVKALSPTYKKVFGNDYEKAFKQIKEDVYDLLVKVKSDNYGIVEKSRLHSAFIYKLLAIYFPEKFLPVCTKTLMESICETMNVPFNKNIEMVYYNIELRKLKESSKLTQNWNNGVFLGFCRWLGDNKTGIYNEKELLDQVCEIDEYLDSKKLFGEEREALAKYRINQSPFREALIRKYKKCVLCGISDPGLLVASHIKPWKDSDSTEKTDIDNGFLLCPNHDKLFDRGYISFDEKGIILISKELNEKNRVYANVNEGTKIVLTEGNKRYLEHHRANVYIDG